MQHESVASGAPRWRLGRVLLLTCTLATSFLGARVLGTPSQTAPSATRANSSPETGTITGVVRWTGGAVPAPRRIENTTDPDACGRIQQQQLVQVSPGSRGLADVIVALATTPPEWPGPAVPTRVQIENSRCRFRPHVAVLTVGGTIVAVNRDPMLHTVHLYGPAHENLALPEAGATREIIVHEPGMIMLRCDVHGWMQAYVRVDPHPFHDVTGEDGSFRIGNLPPGTYDVEFWHETLGTQHRSVVVAPGRSRPIQIEYPFERSRP